MWKIILLVLIASIMDCLAIEPNPCCKSGILAGKRGATEDHERECTFSKIGLSNSQRAITSCKFMAKLCCKNALQAMHCGIGKEMAKAGMACSLLGTNLQRSCCSSCKNGLVTTINACKQSRDTSISSRAFKSCCTAKITDSATTPTTESTATTTTTTTTQKPKLRCTDIVCDFEATVKCEETATGPKCTCKNGFQQSEDGINCQKPKKKTCDEITCDRARSLSCIETTSGAKCKCKSGYKQAEDGVTCKDVDECIEADGVSLCYETYGNRYPFCLNEEGYYRCIGECPWPKFYKPLRNVCRDVDECKRGTHNCDKDTHKCVNKVGGYICKRTGCKPGYKFVDGRCDEINICRLKPCPSGHYCYKFFGQRQCIEEKCPNSNYYEQSRPNDIAECAKRFCDNVRDRNEKKQCWDASVYPSSIKRYAYKYKTEIPYKAFKFNYWWNFDEQKYTVDARLLGNQNGDFYMLTRRKDLDVFNQRHLNGPKTYKLIVQVDVKERTYQQTLIWRFHTYLYVNIA